MLALVNGIHLHYVQAGEGIPLLLIHGYPSITRCGSYNLTGWVVARK